MRPQLRREGPHPLDELRRHYYVNTLRNLGATPAVAYFIASGWWMLWRGANHTVGNRKQIDTPYLTETTSGMTYVVDRFKHWEHSGHITLMSVERSRLADYASDML